MIVDRLLLPRRNIIIEVSHVGPIGAARWQEYTINIYHYWCNKDDHKAVLCQADICI